MNVTREVILDLLPLYLAGEASPASRALVDAYLRQDPELAERVRLHDRTLLPDSGVAPRPEAELATLVRTRRTLARLRWTCALACVLTAMALSLRIEFDGARLTSFRFLLAEHPLPLGICLAAAAVLWVLYFRLRRGARITGLA